MGGNDTGNGVGGMLHVREHSHQGLGGLGRGTSLRIASEMTPSVPSDCTIMPARLRTGNALDRARTRHDHFARGVEEFVPLG